MSLFTNRSTVSYFIITQLFYDKRHQLYMKEGSMWYYFLHLRRKIIGAIMSNYMGQKKIDLWGNRISINDEKQHFTID